jgi:hypothetical protein
MEGGESLHGENARGEYPQNGQAWRQAIKTRLPRERLPKRNGARRKGAVSFDALSCRKVPVALAVNVVSRLD